jgi:hypothetical protein
MTLRADARSVIVMRSGRFTPNGLIVLALTAVVSLAAGHLVDIGTQIFGPGAASTPALVGDIAGLIACAISVRFGLRRILRSQAC